MNQDISLKIKKPRTDDKQLWDIYSGKFAYKTLLVAHNLKLFTLLAKKALTLAEVSQLLQINSRGAETLLMMLVCVRLLQVEDGFYSLTSIAEDYLLKSSPTYFGGFLDVAIAAEQEFSLQNLKKALLTKPSSVYAGEKMFQSHALHPTLARAFTHAMHGHSMAAAMVWPELIDLSRNKLLLDIGGGSGAHAISATLKWSNLQALVIDLASVCDIAREYIAQYGLQNRIETDARNMFSEPLPLADIHFYSNIYHDWPPQTGRFLTQKSFESLEPGGRIVIHEMLYNDQKTGPVGVAANNMVMYYWQEGQQSSGHELSTMLISTGFTDVEVKPTVGYWSIVTGLKPSETN
ncbi:methyltransferase [Fischerella sp. JS2]|uniref:methyltransferase n=1 Tax=Fischerella sp. JS2 TaxID=2597771 RepID=UPI0028E8A4B4|nr:methyltransferase [Fischerella sp. JS2]